MAESGDVAGRGICALAPRLGGNGGAGFRGVCHWLSRALAPDSASRRHPASAATLPRRTWIVGSQGSPGAGDHPRFLLRAGSGRSRSRLSRGRVTAPGRISAGYRAGSAGDFHALANPVRAGRPWRHDALSAAARGRLEGSAREGHGVSARCRSPDRGARPRRGTGWRAPRSGAGAQNGNSGEPGATALAAAGRRIFRTGSCADRRNAGRGGV